MIASMWTLTISGETYISVRNVSVEEFIDAQVGRQIHTVIEHNSQCFLSIRCC